MWSWDIRCSVKLTVIAARTVLNYFENDDRLRKAIEIAEEWLKKYQFDVDYCTALSWDLSPPPADSLAAEAANCATSGRIAQVSDKAKFETLLGLYIKKLVELGYDDEITRAQAIMLAAIQVSTAQATKGEIHTKMMEWLNERRLLES